MSAICRSPSLVWECSNRFREILREAILRLAGDGYEPCQSCVSRRGVWTWFTDGSEELDPEFRMFSCNSLVFWFRPKLVSFGDELNRSWLLFSIELCWLLPDIND
ncbi:hypothetical protein BpHYR1_012429 [Brachionus plicatilis]|uniref:Uncharacterized protein n=1 Tax=Brachionus plicatilis TaxID=10195 RepID=A0A3M7SNY2_BRAPC|nr:hypothetical protein BpHYR1_012429 [Brachionus plicatilis]